MPSTSPTIRKLQADRAILINNARAIMGGALSEDRAPTDDEESSYQAAKSKIDALTASIEREKELLALESTVDPRAAGWVEVHDNREDDPRRNFASFGEFARAVHSAYANPMHGLDNRLMIGAAAPSTFANESTGGDGGYLVPPEFSREIWRLSMEAGSLIPYTSNTEVQGNSMVFPKDETTPWDTTGVQAFWRGEGLAGTPTKPIFKADMMRLYELMVLVPVTNELLNDGSALDSYLRPLAAERIQWKTNEAILFGDGAGKPTGCVNANSSALIVVAKESGQAASTILQPNISKMRARLKVGELANAIWLGNPDILPALEGLTVGNIPIFLPPGTGIRENYDGTLNGRPLILSEHASAFSSQGDLMLLSLKGYRTITKAGGVQTDTSMHLYFDANATAFRFIFRIDGKPIISAPIQPPAGKSSNTRSYFVALGAR